MRKLIISEWLSLDGFVSDKNGQLDFFAGLVRDTFAEPEQVAFLQTIDTVLMGRATYQQFSAVWPNVPLESGLLAQRMNQANKIVFSQSLKEAPWGAYESAFVEARDAAPAIRALKSAPGKDIVLFASISLAQAAMRENLVDEYHLFICPVLTGGGRRLFMDESCGLRLASVNRCGGGVVCLKYEA